MNHLNEVLASVLEYPGSDWNARMERCKQWLTIQEPEIAVRFLSFQLKVRTTPVEKLQEVYTQTFDLNPVCTLDIGYHLFGENYKRGELLASLRETEAPYQLGQAEQLPDYLPVLLRLLAKLKDKDLRQALIADLMVPAVGKMLRAFGDGENPYRDLMEVIDMALRNDLPEGVEIGRPGADDAIPELYRISSKAGTSKRGAGHVECR